MANRAVEKNPMRDLKIAKVVVNISAGQSGDPLEHAMTIMQQLTGQKPCQRFAKQTIRSFGIRKKEPIACMVSLRGKRAEEFLVKALSAVGNRINPKSFDKSGNFAFGIKEHIDIPGTRYDPALGITGMDVLVSIERPGYSVNRRKHAKAKVGKSHRVTPTESMEFIKEKFGIEVGTSSD
jgi:large subunit ribosomal protein L5